VSCTCRRTSDGLIATCVLIPELPGSRRLPSTSTELHQYVPRLAPSTLQHRRAAEWSALTGCSLPVAAGAGGTQHSGCTTSPSIGAHGCVSRTARPSAVRSDQVSHAENASIFLTASPAVVLQALYGDRRNELPARSSCQRWTDANAQCVADLSCTTITLAQV
jgi:hypothetical protein